MRRDVVVTGMGVLSSAGRGVLALAKCARDGTCSLAPDPELEALGMRCRLSGRLADVDAHFAELSLDGVSPSFFSRHARIGAIAASDALAAAKGAPIGRVLVASAAGPMGELELCFRDTLLGRAHPKRAHAVTRVTPSFIATHLARVTKAPRGGKTVSCACVSAIDALRDAFELVANGSEDAVLVGAVEEDSPSTWWAFDAQRLLCRSSPGPARHGFAPAGGAAFFVVEAKERADERGARALAKISGVSLRSSGETPSPLAFPAAAYREALGDMRAIGGPSVDLVLAHAPPTVADADELAVIDEAFAVAAAGVPVRSFKSLFGYALAAAAAIDLALGIERLVSGQSRRVLKTAYAQSGMAGAVMLDAA